MGIRKTKEMNVNTNRVEIAHVSGALKIAQDALNDLPMTLMRLLHVVGAHTNYKEDTWKRMCKIKHTIDQRSMKCCIKYG